MKKYTFTILYLQNIAKKPNALLKTCSRYLDDIKLV